MSESEMSDKESENQDDALGTADLAPTKQIYKSAAVDVDPIDAVEELIDNAIDNWMRESRRVDDVTIDIVAKGGTTKVSDNTGGLSRERIKILFALGDTFQDEVEGSIGAYGIGAKKALVRLGEQRLVTSRDRDAEYGVGFRVDEEWMESDDWEVSLERFDGMKPGETTLEVESSDDIWNEERIDQLRRQLGQTYKLFLSGDVSGAGDFDIVLNGDPIKPAPDIPWSFTPFDNLHPRRYSNIELHPKGIDTPVMMDVTVGQMTNADAEKGGTDFYCQHRLVTQNEREEVGGYGSVGENRIGNFTSHNNRLKVVVELRTDGDSSDLPWDGQKKTIDPHHPVSRVMYDWLRRIVRPYFKANTGTVKEPFTGPYDTNSEYAANDGKVEVLDYNGREKVMNRPDRSFTDIKKVTRLVEEHIKRGYKYYGNIEEEFVPAYDAYYERYFDKQHDGDLKLEDVPVKESLDEDERVDVEDEAMSLSDLINSVSGVGSGKKDALMSEGYGSIEQIHEASVGELTTVRGIGTSMAKRLKDATADYLGEESDSEESDDGTEEGTELSAADDTSSEDESPSTDEKQSQSTADSETASAGETTATEAKTAEDDELSETSEGHQATLAEPDEDQVRLAMDLDEDEYERLCEMFGIDEDDPQQLSETLRERILSMFAPAQ